jgi:hypothetical protein
MHRPLSCFARHRYSRCNTTKRHEKLLSRKAMLEKSALRTRLVSRLNDFDFQFQRSILMKKFSVIAALVVSGLATEASASFFLDLTSGSRTTEKATTGSYTDYDTYREDSFTLQVESDGNHMDTGYGSGIYWHNGSANQVFDNNIRLTYDLGNFDLTEFAFGPTWDRNLTFTGSNGNVQTVVAGAGAKTLTGFTNVSWVSISIDGNTSGGFGYLDYFSGSASPVPEPASLAMWGLGALGACVYVRRRKRQQA